MKVIEPTELTEAELDVVGGGAGSATFTFTNAADPPGHVVGVLFQATTASLATTSASFTSSSLT